MKIHHVVISLQEYSARRTGSYTQAYGRFLKKSTGFVQKRGKPVQNRGEADRNYLCRMDFHAVHIHEVCNAGVTGL